MIWAILIDNIGPDYWWASTFGKSLIDEISEVMRGGADAITKDVTRWAREQVSLGLDQDVS